MRSSRDGRDGADLGGLYFDEASNLTDKDISRLGKIIDKGNYKKHRSMYFWRFIGCRIFGHKADFKKTRTAVAPGLYCARCFSWVITAASTDIKPRKVR